MDNYVDDDVSDQIEIDGDGNKTRRPRRSTGMQQVQKYRIDLNCLF